MIDNVLIYEINLRLGIFCKSIYEISSINSSAMNFAHDCLPFLKKEFYGEIPNLISKRSDGRTR